MTGFAVSHATRFTLRESVIDSLRKAIADGTLGAGTHLAEVELSESFGVSRATLREALRHLQQEGLLTQDTRGRVSVRRLAANEIRDIFEVRLALESVAVERLCAREPAEREEVVAQLEAKLTRLKYNVSLADDLDADLSFHDTLCSLAGNAVLYQSWLGLSSLIRVTMIAAGPTPARENMTFDRHAPIVGIIASGDASSARKYIAVHMATAVDLLTQRMNANKAD